MIIATALPAQAYGGVFQPAIEETIGYIDAIDGELLYISGEAITARGREEVFIDISAAPVYDLLTGGQVSIHNMQQGMSIRAAYETNPMASHLDPLAAVVLWLNWDSPHAAVFTAEVSGNVQHYPGHTVFLSKDGKYRITATDETYISCPHQGRLTPADIRAGQEFFVWVDMITASSPANVYPDKLVRVL